MAYYGINELTQSGVTASLVQAGGFARSTVFGTSSAHTHQFTGSVRAKHNVYVDQLLSGSWIVAGTDAAVVDEPIFGAFGSSIIGNHSGNIHQFTGSVRASGSLHVTGSQINSGSLFSVKNADLHLSGSNIQFQGDPFMAGWFVEGFSDIGISSPTGFVNAYAMQYDIFDGLGTVSINNGGTSIGGVNTPPSNINFEVHYTGSKNPVNLTADTGGGDVIYYGITATTTTQGYLHYLNENGKWELANANATGSSGETGAGNAGLLAIALGTDPEADGMLTRGYYNLPAGAGSVMLSAWVTGSAVYVYSGSAGDAGKYTCDAPTAADSYTRIIGYCTTQSQVVYFNPDSSWIENGP
jgi:hypothetical protein